MKRVDALLADYGSHHRARGNLVCHAFGITLIVFGIASVLTGPRVGLASFFVGWIFQAVGHTVYEKNRPAFFKNLLHLLVGPLFLMNDLLRIRRPAPA
jgi:uncharacterized membrane protein YGL010W